MIIHISIPANNPQHVASIIAEITGGISKPFPPVTGGYMVYLNDANSTGIEIYPNNVILVPGKEAGQKFQVEKIKKNSKFSTTHFALSINNNQTTIQKIADRENWRMCFHRRANRFNVYEFWIENTIMIELIFPEDREEALEALKTNVPTR